MADPPAVPLQAILEAAGVLSCDPGDMDARTWAQAILQAAAPIIRAAEREACAQLAEQEAARGQKPGLDRIILRSFAAQLRKDPHA